jgi:hypothetical protein
MTFSTSSIRSSSSSSIASFALAAALLVPAIARAQDPEAAALFAAAKDLASKGQWADACPKFEAAQRKEPALGTLMNVADCHEHTLSIFRSWGEWRLAYEQAKKANDDARADLAKRRADAIEPRLPHLKVVVSGMQSDLSVWRDDKELDTAEYNTDLPIDPGSRTITVRRGADTIASTKVDLKEKAHELVTFDLDAIAKSHPAPVATTSGGSKTGDGRAVVQTNTVVVNGGSNEPKSTPAGKVAANIFLGVGLTAAVFGGAFMGVATALSSNKSSDCTQVSAPQASPTQWVCNSNTAANITTAQTLAQVGQWVAVGGAVLVVTAIVLFIVVPKEKEKERTAPVVGFGPIPGGAALSLGGAF